MADITSPPRRRWFHISARAFLFLAALLAALGGWSDPTVRRDDRPSRSRDEALQKWTLEREKMELPFLWKMHLGLLEQEQQLKYECGLKRKGVKLPISWCGTEGPGLDTVIQRYEETDVEDLSPTLQVVYRQIVADLRNIQKLENDLKP